MAKQDTKRGDEIEDLWARHKRAILLAVCAIVILGLCGQAYLYFSEQLKEGDLTLKSIGWSEYCDGRAYTAQDVIDFCGNCSERPKTGIKSGCMFPVDMRFIIDKVDRTINTGGEIHCHMIIDGFDQYAESGRYYGVTSPELFTWELLDAREAHDMRFCCAIQRSSLISVLFGEDKSLDQVCVSGHVEARCR